VSVVIHDTFEKAVRAGGRVFEVLATCYCDDRCQATRYATGGTESEVHAAASGMFEDHAIHVEDLGDENECEGCGANVPLDVIVWIDGRVICSGCDYRRSQCVDVRTAADARADSEWDKGADERSE
jgi:hypothetical protein